MRTVILVHGFWHGSWCWTPLTAQLAARGVPSVAVDLSGHGLGSRSPQVRWARPFGAGEFATEPSPVAGITTASAAATLIEQIRLIGNGEPCVVVAHSMGGVVATQAAELAPELFAHLIHVSAYAPITGSVIDYAALPEAAGAGVTDLLAADPAAVGALRYDTGDPARRSAFREVFYGDVDVDTADAAIGLLSSDAPLLPSLDRVTVAASRYGSIPHTYVVCAQDRAIPEAAASCRTSTRSAAPRRTSSRWTRRTRRSCRSRRHWPTRSSPPGETDGYPPSGTAGTHRP